MEFQWQKMSHTQILSLQRDKYSIPKLVEILGAVESIGELLVVWADPGVTFKAS